MELGDLSIDPGTIATIIFGFFVQSIAFWKWLSAQFKSRDDALDVIKDMFHREITRVDREVSVLRTETRERLATVPTRDQIEELFDRKLSRMENQLDALMREFARLVSRRSMFRPDDE